MKCSTLQLYYTRFNKIERWKAQEHGQERQFGFCYGFQLTLSNLLQIIWINHTASVWVYTGKRSLPTDKLLKSVKGLGRKSF